MAHTSELRQRITELNNPRIRWAGSKDEIAPMLRDGAGVVVFEEKLPDLNWDAATRYMRAQSSGKDIDWNSANKEEQQKRINSVTDPDAQKALQHIANRSEDTLAHLTKSNPQVLTIRNRRTENDRNREWHWDSTKKNNIITHSQTFVGPSTEYRTTDRKGFQTLHLPTGTLTVHDAYQSHRAPLHSDKPRLLSLAEYNRRDLK